MPRPELLHPQLHEPPSDFSSYKTPEERWNEAVAELLPREVKKEEKKPSDTTLSTLLSSLKATQSNDDPLPSYKPTKPKLSGHYMERLLKGSVLRLEKASIDSIETQEECIQWICSWMNSLSDDLLRQAKESAEKLKEKETWSTLSKMASAALGALSMLFGASLVATGGGALLGSLLMASGYFSLVNLICEETGAWDFVASELAPNNKELQQNLRTWLPFSLSMFTMITGAIGSTWAFFTQAFNTVNQILLWGNNLSGIGEGLLRLGDGRAQHDYLKTDAERDKLQTKHDLVSTDLSTTLGELRALTRATTLSIKEARTAVTAYGRAMREYRG